MNDIDCLQVATAANTIARWCALQDVRTLSRETLRGEAGLAEGMADLFVLFGGAVAGIVEALAQAMQAQVARRYAIVGGRGHATYWLDQTMERELEHWDAGTPRPHPGQDSEAEQLAALLRLRHGLRVDFLETHSTNCGNNISYLLDLLEREGTVPRSVILCQDAVMQRRMSVTWQRQVADRAAFAHTRIVNWPAYTASLVVEGEGLAWVSAPEGMWSLDTYLGLLVGEVMRLTDDENGYGPCGRDFVVHVEVPRPVAEAAELLAACDGAYGRPPDERYG